MMKEEVISRYRKSGKIAKKALTEAKEYVAGRKNINLFELCEYLENIIKKAGAAPAFPCNVSFNEIAAHYSPVEDEIIEFKEGILKIDVGAMIDGYIADTAISIARGYEYERLCKVNRDILRTVLDLIRPGVRLGKIGEYVEEEAKANGYRPISNLSGHMIKQYDLHAGKNVPNVKEILSPRVEADEVYAVEPFLTFGNRKGKVKSGDIATIYALKKVKRIKKDKILDKLKNKIFSERKNLPFSPRWYYNLFGKENTLEHISQLYSLGYLHAYPILIEASRGVVSQYEHTVIVLESGNVVTTT